MSCNKSYCTYSNYMSNYVQISLHVLAAEILKDRKKIDIKKGTHSTSKISVCKTPTNNKDCTVLFFTHLAPASLNKTKYYYL